MEKTSIEAIAKKYDLAVDFVKSLHDKIIDKENFARAVKMFNDGLKTIKENGTYDKIVGQYL